MHVGEHLFWSPWASMPLVAAPAQAVRGTTENAADCRSLVGSLIDRGLPEDRQSLVGGLSSGHVVRHRAIDTVIHKTWGELALHHPLTYLSGLSARRSGR